jgi:putative salt-induced outer membrane protein YdiY
MQGHQERSSSSDVISIETQKQNFWRQLKGSIDVGYDFTSGNTQTSLSSDASATYTTTTWSAGASYNAAYSGQSGGSKTKLVELTGTGERFLNRNSFLFGIADFLHSSQQDLQLRTTLGGGYGRYFIRTNHNVLRWLIGPAYTHEDYQSASRKPSQQAVNALLGLLYQLFRFDRYSLQSQMLLYPALSNAGLLLMTTRTTSSVKLENNSHMDFSFWDNFDSQPPANAKRNELGVSNSLGWTF